MERLAHISNIEGLVERLALISNIEGLVERLAHIDNIEGVIVVSQVIISLDKSFRSTDIFVLMFLWILRTIYTVLSLWFYLCCI